MNSILKQNNYIILFYFFLIFFLFTVGILYFEYKYSISGLDFYQERFRFILSIACNNVNDYPGGAVVEDFFNSKIETIRCNEINWDLFTISDISVFELSHLGLIYSIGYIFKLSGSNDWSLLYILSGILFVMYGLSVF